MTKQLAHNSRLLDRLRVVLDRQSVMKWGPHYEPAIQAVVGEAPRQSHAYAMPSSRLERRIHALSKPERAVCALALYHDSLWDLHEQHVLPMWPTPHPLALHPVWRAYPWPSTQGTIEIAARLGLDGFHPTFTTSVPGQRVRVPYPWIGDFLLYLNDGDGPYVVSWDCKATPDRHGKPGPAPLRIRESAQAHAKADARERIYRACMDELGIRIQRVSDIEVDLNVRCNLRRLCSLHPRKILLADALVADLYGAYEEGLKSGEPPVAIIHRLVRSGSDDQMQARCVLDHLIWTRQLRVDLFRPIEPNRPLNPETRDVLSVYSHLFAR